MTGFSMSMIWFGGFLIGFAFGAGWADYKRRTQ